MSVNKFGTHILKHNDDRELSYYCILPIIGDHEFNKTKLPNGEERFTLSINGENNLIFPLPEAEVKSVHSPPSLEFIINNNIFSSKDLIGHTLSYGDEIFLLRSTTNTLPRRIFIGLILKCKVQSEDE